MNSKALKHFFRLTGRLISIADAIVDALILLGVELAVILVDLLHLGQPITPTQFASADQLIQGPGSRGVDHSQSGHAIDQTEMLQLDECFAECARVTQVSTRYDDPVRNLPPESLEDPENDRSSVLRAGRD